MTVIVELLPETEAGLATLAAERGVSLEEYVRRLLEGQVQDYAHKPLSSVDRVAAWRESVRDLPHTTPLSDDAISRESMYDLRG